MDDSENSSTLTSSNPDEFDEHNNWNIILGLVPYWDSSVMAHIDLSMEALFDEEDLGRIALSCNFALDVFCDNKERDTLCKMALDVASLLLKWPY